MHVWEEFKTIINTFILLLDVVMGSFQAHLSLFPRPPPISREMPRSQICSGGGQGVGTSHFLYPVFLLPLSLTPTLVRLAPVSSKQEDFC